MQRPKDEKCLLCKAIYKKEQLSAAERKGVLVRDEAQEVDRGLVLWAKEKRLLSLNYYGKPF